ncbi:hypothetical protein J6590_049485 [Homalodisca vitripennis]|nr:hypothetical protein J6590_049485 [Homalodisca vitripennis]
MSALSSAPRSTIYNNGTGWRRSGGGRGMSSSTTGITTVLEDTGRWLMNDCLRRQEFSSSKNYQIRSKKPQCLGRLKLV